MEKSFLTEILEFQLEKWPYSFRVTLIELTNIFRRVSFLETRFLKALRKHFDESIKRKKDELRMDAASRALKDDLWIEG